METLFPIIAVILILFLFITFTRKGVPNALKEPFKQKFPQARNIEWTKEPDYYEVVFYHERKQKKARFDYDGNWLETKEILYEEQIPDGVKKTVEKKYPECKYYEISRYENDKGQKFHKLILSRGPMNYLLKIDDEFEVLQTRNLTMDKREDYERKKNFIDTSLDNCE